MNRYYKNDEGKLIAAEDYRWYVAGKIAKHAFVWAVGVAIGLAIGHYLRSYQPAVLLDPRGFGEVFTVEPAIAKEPKKAKTWTGYASYYSKAGCLGCNSKFKMANGEILDDTKYTLAQNQIPLNTIVKVKNLTNGKEFTAKVTDRGGFNKYNRTADLSLALATDLGVRTDRDKILITVIN